jgi:hypothetical protein
MNLHQRPEATSIGPGGAFDSKWVSPVGVPRVGTRHTGTGGAGSWGTQGVEWCPDASSLAKASSQTRRCRAAEEMRGPPSGRAQEGRRQPPGEISGSQNKISASDGRS